MWIRKTTKLGKLASIWFISFCNWCDELWSIIDRSISIQSCMALSDVTTLRAENSHLYVLPDSCCTDLLLFVSVNRWCLVRGHANSACTVSVDAAGANCNLKAKGDIYGQKIQLPKRMLLTVPLSDNYLFWKRYTDQRTRLRSVVRKFVIFHLNWNLLIIFLEIETVWPAYGLFVNINLCDIILASNKVI